MSFWRAKINKVDNNMKSSNNFHSYCDHCYYDQFFNIMIYVFSIIRLIIYAEN